MFALLAACRLYNYFQKEEEERVNETQQKEQQHNTTQHNLHQTNATIPTHHHATTVLQRNTYNATATENAFGGINCHTLRNKLWQLQFEDMLVEGWWSQRCGQRCHRKPPVPVKGILNNSNQPTVYDFGGILGDEAEYNISFETAKRIMKTYCKDATEEPLFPVKRIQNISNLLTAHHFRGILGDNHKY